MPKANSEKAYNTFVKGIITEVSALTYPENASLDQDNLVLERTNVISRRYGVEYEDSYALKATGTPAELLIDSPATFHMWGVQSGNTDINIGVVRIYNHLWFINLLSATYSTSFLNSGNPITISGLTNSRIDTAVINNNFIFSSAEITSPILLTYDVTTDVVTQAYVSLSVRDFWGVDDGLTVTNRPTTLSDTHKYNLRNQGWNSDIVSICGTDPLDCTKTNLGYYPSNADIWTLGKEELLTSADYAKYVPATLIKNSTDNSQSARGHFIIDAFTRGSSRISQTGITGLPTDFETGKITTVASYAGRVFYAGIYSTITGKDSLSPNFSGTLLFSQIAISTSNLGKCYQEADPTSNNISDVIDTDGGTIQIPDVTKIYKLLATKSSLLIFAENGVWEMFGDTGGFTATAFQVSKITSIGCSSPRSIVEVNGSVFYWTKSGIFMLVQEPTTGRYSAENITIKTIQSYYNSFSSTAIDDAIGFFEEKENRVRWMFYHTCEVAGVLVEYDRELILDLTLEAFYPHSITPLTSSSPHITDYVPIPNYYLSSVTAGSNVYAANDQVLVTADEVIVAASEVNERAASRVPRFKFLTVVGTSFTFSEYSNTGFMDWEIASGSTGMDYNSYIITGYEIFADTLRKKQVPYLVTLFNRSENGYTLVGSDLVLNNQSSCMVQAQWNFADSIYSGKWGNEFQAYRLFRSYTPYGTTDPFNYGESVIVTKNKLRGRGRAISLYIYSEEGKDLQILGWSLLMEGGARP
jgi:hypothetical protein